MSAATTALILIACLVVWTLAVTVRMAALADDFAQHGGSVSTAERITQPTFLGGGRSSPSDPLRSWESAVPIDNVPMTSLIDKSTELAPAVERDCAPGWLQAQGKATLSPQAMLPE